MLYDNDPDSDYQIYTITVDNGTVLSASATLPYYANALYFLKLLSPPGQELLHKLTHDIHPTLRTLLTQQLSDNEDNEDDEDDEDFLPNLLTAIFDSLPDLLEISFSKHFKKRDFEKFINENQTRQLIKLNDGLEYIDLESFCKAETAETIDKVEWDMIMGYFSDMITNTKAPHMSDWREEFEDFDYQAPPIRPEDIVTFRQMSCEVLQVLPANKSQENAFTKAYAEQSKPDDLDISDCPIEILHVCTVTVTHTSRHIGPQQVFHFIGKILWNDVPRSRKNDLYEELDWNHLKLQSPFDVHVSGLFIVADKNIISVETLDNRDYLNPNEFRFKPLDFGWEVIVEAYTKSSLSWLSSCSSKPKEILEQLGKQLDENQNKKIPVQTFTILPYPEYRACERNEELELLHTHDNIEQNLRTYNVLLHFGFLNTGEIHIYYQHNDIRCRINPETRQIIFEIYADGYIDDEVADEFEPGYDMDSFSMFETSHSFLYDYDNPQQHMKTEHSPIDSLLAEAWGDFIQSLDLDPDEGKRDTKPKTNSSKDSTTTGDKDQKAQTKKTSKKKKKDDDKTDENPN